MQKIFLCIDLWWLGLHHEVVFDLYDIFTLNLQGCNPVACEETLKDKGKLDSYKTNTKHVKAQTARRFPEVHCVSWPGWARDKTEWNWKKHLLKLLFLFDYSVNVLVRMYGLPQVNVSIA